MTNQRKHTHGGKRARAGRPSRAPIAKRVNFKASTVCWLASRGAVGPEVRRIVEAVEKASQARLRVTTCIKRRRITDVLLKTVLDSEEGVSDGK